MGVKWVTIHQGFLSPKQTVEPVKWYTKKSHMCVCVSGKEKQRIYIVAVKSVTNLSQAITIWRIRKGFYTQDLGRPILNLFSPGPHPTRH